MISVIWNRLSVIEGMISVLRLDKVRRLVVYYLICMMLLCLKDGSYLRVIENR